MIEHDPARYPIDCLDPVTRDAVKEILSCTGVAEPLAAMSAQAADAISCQGLVAFRNPSTGLVCPANQFFLLVLEPSEWRSTIDDYFMREIYAHDARSMELHAVAQDNYKVELEAWKAAAKGFRGRHASVDPADEKYAQSKDRLEAHQRLEPKPPRLRQHLFQDATKVAILEALEGTGESIGFVTDEADVLYEAGLMRSEGFGNKLFDGDKPLKWRRKKQDLDCRDPKVTVSIMAHPVAFQDRRKKRGKLSRGTGHDARYLVAAPPPKKGTRNVRGLPDNMPALNRFSQRIRARLELREAQLLAGTTAVEVLEFSDEAKKVWFDKVEWLERQQLPGGFFADTAEFASKFMGLAGRVATRQHYARGVPGPILAETLERAVQIVWFHACEFRRFFSEELKAEELRRKASNLKAFLHRHHWLGASQPTEVTKNEVLQGFHPKDVAEFNQLLDILVNEGAISVSKGKPTKITLLIPAFIQAVGPTHGIFYTGPIAPTF